MIDERTLNEIRQAESCLNYLTKSKHGKSKHGGYICPCSDCESGNNSNLTGAVYYYNGTNTWFCHACKKGGDVIKLYQITQGVDFLTAVKALAEKNHITIEYDNEPYNAARRDYKPEEGKPMTKTENAKQGQTQAKESMPQDFTEYYTRCRERLTEREAIAYLDARGISLQTAAAYNVGYDPQADPCNFPGAADDAKKKYPMPAIIFPVSKSYYDFRAINNDNARKGNPKGTSPKLFNIKAIYTQEAQEVFITESVIDALSIIEAGGQAIATNSTSNAALLIEQLKKEPTAATLIICYDADASGQKGTAYLQEELNKLNVCNITVDKSFFIGTKDANEALVKNRLLFEESVFISIGEAQEARRRAQAQEEERKQKTGAQMIDRFLDAVKTKKYEPTPTGITAIDDAIGGGFIRQQLILLGAAPGTGKTALTAWIFETMAAKGHNCLFLNLEMSQEQMLARSISRITAKNGNKIKPTDILQGYKWSPEQERAVIAAADEYKTEIAPHMIYNPDGVKPELDCILEYIEKEAQRAEAAHEPAPSVVIDYLQIVRGREREEDSAIIKRAVAAFKDFAIKHNTFVFCIMAQNRKANESGKATQEAGRDTSALEYSADLQLSLTYTACLPKKQGGKKKKIEELSPEEEHQKSLVITKGRWGAVGTPAHLYFNGETMTFTQTAPEFREEQPANGWANAKSE